MSERSGAGKGQGKRKILGKTEAVKWDAVGRSLRTVLGEETADEMVTTRPHFQGRTVAHGHA